MFEPTNLTEYVGKTITDLRANRHFDEVRVFDHPKANCRIHFFRTINLRHAAKGVVVMRDTDIIDRVLPGMATADKKNKAPEFKAEHCIMPIYYMLGEIAFRRWLADDDMREAMVKNYDGIIYNRDPLFYSLLIYHGVARAERQPKSRGLWPYAVLTWDTDVRFQYRGKERFARRRLSYKFAENPRQASRVEAEYRIHGSRRDNNAPNLTLSRKYPIDNWANTKTFMSQPENIPYLDALFNEMDRKKK